MGSFLSYRPRTKCSFLQFLQDKLHSFNIQDDRSTRFLCTTNYRISDHIIKHFQEENLIISELFSQNNLILCGMQGNNGLLAKLFKNIRKSPTASRFSLLTSAKLVVRTVLV